MTNISVIQEGTKRWDSYLEVTIVRNKESTKNDINLH